MIDDEDKVVTENKIRNRKGENCWNDFVKGPITGPLNMKSSES